MGKASRVKGRKFEQKIAIDMRGIFDNAYRGAAQCRDGAYAPDVDGTPFWIECKKGKKTYPKKALEQARDAVKKNNSAYIPIAVTADDRAPIITTMYWDDFVSLVSSWVRVFRLCTEDGEIPLEELRYYLNLEKKIILENKIKNKDKLSKEDRDEFDTARETLDKIFGYSNRKEL